MAEQTRLVITDVDNTLYDWVTFFSLSFRAMAEELGKLLNIPIPSDLSGIQISPSTLQQLGTAIRYLGITKRPQAISRS
jgi:hypothetical protein